MVDPKREGLLAELVGLLGLEKIEENLFVGRSQDLGFGALFGGQVLGQALSAASQTVPTDRRAHSLHAYFLRPGDVTKRILYEVDAIRDGTSFTTRRVRAIQGGRAIFSAEASFQVEEPGFDHQCAAPLVPSPDGLASEWEMLQEFEEQIPVASRPQMLAGKPIEIRPVDATHSFDAAAKDPVHCRWIRAAARLPDDPWLHRCLLAYASDFYLLCVALRPHGHTFWEPEIQLASVDHAIWFHREFRMDDWLLYAMESPNASGGRGLSLGRIFDRGGRLVASVAQEGLIRNWAAAGGASR